MTQKIKKGDLVICLRDGFGIDGVQHFTNGKIYKISQVEEGYLHVLKSDMGLGSFWIDKFFKKFEGDEEVSNLLYSEGEDDNEKR